MTDAGGVAMRAFVRPIEWSSVRASVPVEVLAGGGVGELRASDEDGAGNQVGAGAGSDA
jgi:hypothetical protein